MCRCWNSEDDPIPEGIRHGVSFAFWSSRKVLGEMADQLAPDVTDEFRKFVREAPHEWSAPVMDELRRLIPRGIIDSLALVGTAPQIVDAAQGAGAPACRKW